VQVCGEIKRFALADSRRNVDSLDQNLRACGVPQWHGPHLDARALKLRDRCGGVASRLISVAQENDAACLARGKKRTAKAEGIGQIGSFSRCYAGPLGECELGRRSFPDLRLFGETDDTCAIA
jgi:hypothetical protein